MDQRSIAYAFQSTESSIQFINGTSVSNQPYFINSILADIDLNETTISDITSDSYIITVASTNLIISDTEVYGVTNSEGAVFIFASEDSNVHMINFDYHDSTTMMLSAITSESIIQDSVVSGISLGDDHLVNFVFSTNLVMDNTTVSNIDSTKSSVIAAMSSSISSISN